MKLTDLAKEAEIPPTQEVRTIPNGALTIKEVIVVEDSIMARIHRAYLRPDGHLGAVEAY